jgi:ribosomal-protein-alanine N-acetyltransferase
MMRIRRAEAGMLPALYRIETACFSSPWSEDSVSAELGDESSVFLTAEDESGPFGFVIVKIAADECEVYNIAVLPEHRRKGAARALLEAALEKARALGAHSAYLEVRESNEAAKKLYFSMDFVALGLRKDYYYEPRENAVLMKKELQ